jgi:hypothetical protein
MFMEGEAVKRKNGQLGDRGIPARRTTWLLLLALLALLWPGQTLLASTLLSRQVVGEVHLQGRQDHSDIEIQITDESGLVNLQTLDGSPAQPIIVNTEGMFSVQAEGKLVITVRRPGYLDAQVMISAASDEAVNLGATTLYGGEVTGDNLIDIGDLSYLGAKFHTPDALGDINGDGVVDILDLSVAASNYRMRGPTSWGE